VLLWFDDFGEFLLQGWASFGRFNDPLDLSTMDVEHYCERKLVNIECHGFGWRWRDASLEGRVEEIFHETTKNADLNSCGFSYQSQNGNVLAAVFAPRSREDNYEVVAGELSQLIYSIDVQLACLFSRQKRLFVRLFQVVEVLVYGYCPFLSLGKVYVYSWTLQPWIVLTCSRR